MATRIHLRRTLPLLITLIAGVLIILDFFVSGLPVSSQSVPILSKWATIIWGFAMPYSVLTLVIDHLKIIKKQTPGRWYYSIWMLVLIALMLYQGFTEGTGGDLYTELFTYMAAPVLSTVSGMLGLYALAASFRVWHARTPEALTMIIAGYLVVLGIIAPIGEIIWPGFGPLANFFNDYVFKAERTVFYIGTSVSAILLGIRTLLGYETYYMRVED